MGCECCNYLASSTLCQRLYVDAGGAVFVAWGLILCFPSCWIASLVAFVIASAAASRMGSSRCCSFCYCRDLVAGAPDPFACSLAVLLDVPLLISFWLAVSNGVLHGIVGLCFGWDLMQAWYAAPFHMAGGIIVVTLILPGVGVLTGLAKLSLMKQDFWVAQPRASGAAIAVVGPPVLVTTGGLVTVVGQPVEV